MVMGGGDKHFAGFVAVSCPRLLHAGWMISGDHSHARDAVRTALELAYARWGRVRQDPFGYCRTVLIEHLADQWWRRSGGYATGPLVFAWPGGMGHEATDQRLLGSVLSGLSAPERAALVLNCYFGLPLAAVARDLHVSAGTVESIVSRTLGICGSQRDKPDGLAAVSAVSGRGRGVPTQGTARHHGFPLNTSNRHRRPAMSGSEQLRRLMLTTEPAVAGVRGLDDIMAAGRRLRRRGWAARAAATGGVLVLSFGVASGGVPGTIFG
jgi:DNA-directed RNA polymerase specialized sigma24 family protein